MKNQNNTMSLCFKMFFFTFFLFLYPLSIKAQDTIVYTADQTLMDIGQHVFIYKDPTNTLSIEQIKNLPDSAFQKSETSLLHLGNTTASTWLKLTVKNQTELPLYLAFKTNSLNILDAYIYDKAGKLTTKETGFTRPLSNRELIRSNIIINIGQSPKVLYFKLESRFLLLLPLVLGRLEHLNDYYHTHDAINGLGMGILIAMALYNLFIFISTKDRLYLYYCLYVLSTLWVILHLNGLGWLIWNDHPIMTRLVGIPFALLTTWLFTVRFLNVDKNMPRTYTAIKIFCILIAGLIPIDFLDLQIPRATLQQICTPLSAIAMLTIGIVSHFQDNKSARYYVLAWVFLLGGGLISSFSYSGKIPYNFYTTNAVLFGACIESIVLALALANRINIYREESAKAQALAFQRLQENETLIREQNKDLEEKVRERTAKLETSLDILKTTQNQLIQSEKLASLGELTAGIAHEIQNPLNFVTNFSELSVDLVKDIKYEIGKNPRTPEGEIIISSKDTEYIDELFTDLSQNQEKINHHGKRASSIVKGMLEHSRTSTGVREMVDINKLVEEYLRLSYHGLRTKDKSFNASMETHFETPLSKIAVVPQDIGRVLLNLINNAFYAVNKQRQNRGTNHTPTVIVSTQKIDNQVVVKIKDNGVGMSESVKAKIFQPFFTTKPAGEGTGLGLSLAYDIVTKGHGGSLEVDSTEDVGTTFTLMLPI